MTKSIQRSVGWSYCRKLRTRKPEPDHWIAAAYSAIIGVISAFALFTYLNYRRN